MLWCKHVTRRDVTCLVMIHGTLLMAMLTIILITLIVHVAFLTLFIERQIQKSQTSQDGISIVQIRSPRPSYPPISKRVTNADVSGRYNYRSHWRNQILLSTGRNRASYLVFNYGRYVASKTGRNQENSVDSKHVLRRTGRVFKTGSDPTTTGKATDGYGKNAESSPWTRTGDSREVTDHGSAYHGSTADISSDSGENNAKYLPRTEHVLRPDRHQWELGGARNDHKMAALELHNLDSKSDEDWEPREDWMTEHLIPTKR